ncbi:hypothetical protein [Maricaulis parjimensis]|uniref:hypothetical protein n=1 Tax=Maricaulis parjimensis TaxID=144023 RepID=UPI00193A4873|nr:hypothetical protein [Maricaulis parjimensis]
MSRWISTLACALAVSLSAGALASAEPARAAAAPGTALTDPSKSQLKQRRDRRDYRDRHYRDRDHRDRRGYRDRRSRHDHGYRDRNRRHGSYHRPHYAAPRCWREERHDRFRGRPAVVSMRVCRDRYGRHYIERGSRRLVYYVGRHHRPRRW